jgi:HEAT repeat protein
MSEEFAKLLDELTDASSDVKVSSLTGLSELSDDEATALRDRWSEIDLRRRRWLVSELIELAEDNVDLNFDRVFLRGLDDDDPGVRLESINGLWEYERSDLIAPLLRMMENDESEAVRAAAALALGRYVMAYETGRLRSRYFEAIEASMRMVLANPDGVEEVRARALEAIGAHDAAWVRQAITVAYESDVRGLKRSAVHAMGRSGEERWLPLVIREMSNEEGELRYEAATAAGAIGDERALPHLVRLAQDTDAEVAQASVMALGEIGGVQAKQALQDLVSDPSPALRQAATEALAGIRFEEDPMAFGLGADEE